MCFVGCRERERERDRQRETEQAEPFNFIKKEALAQVFSCEFCENSKNTFSYTTPLGDCFCLFKSSQSFWRFYSNKTNFCSFIISRLTKNHQYESRLRLKGQLTQTFQSSRMRMFVKKKHEKVHAENFIYAKGFNTKYIRELNQRWEKGWKTEI